MTAALVILMMAAGTIAGVLAGRHEDGPPQGRKAWARTIAYWLFTVVVAFELAAGGVWDLLRIEYVRVVLAHLGYPLYLLDILGAWRIPGALAVLAPRFPRLKEWAYAGAFFDFTGAAASHLFRGDAAGQWITPLVFAAFVLLSWGLRPASRRLGTTTPKDRSALAWSVPVAIVAAMLVVAFFTMPKGAPQ